MTDLCCEEKCEDVFEKFPCVNEAIIIHDKILSIIRWSAISTF